MTPKPRNMTMVSQRLLMYDRVCSELPTACLEAWQRPKISCKTPGCDGSLPIGALLRTQRPFWRQQQQGSASTLFSPPHHAAKPTRVLGFLNQWTQAVTPR